MLFDFILDLLSRMLTPLFRGWRRRRKPAFRYCDCAEQPCLAHTPVPYRKAI